LAWFQTTWKKKIFNVWSGRKRVLMHLRMLPDHPQKKIFFNVWSGRKRVLLHFRMLPDHQKHGLEKDIF
jgi:hypothetical protein